MSLGLHQLLVQAAKPPTVEIDSSSRSVYIRFKTAKVHKTISDDRVGAVLAVDLDGRGQIIGIELVGIRNLTIEEIRQNVPELKGVNFEKARLVSAAALRSEPMAA